MNELTILKLIYALSITVQALWEILVRQTVCVIISDLLVIIMLSVVFCLINTRFIESLKKGGLNYGSSEQDTIMTVVLGFMSLSLFVLLLYAICDGVPEIITCLINPQYWALDKLLHAKT